MIETTLTLPDPVKPRACRIVVDGARLIQTSWSAGGRPRETVKDLGSTDARHAFDKARTRKMREGFCHVADPVKAGRGDVVLEFLAPNRSPADAFDLSPDGRTIALGTTLRDAYGAELHTVDVATGASRLIRRIEPADRQTFIHAVHFDADGSQILYALNGETRVVGPDATLASYREFHDARFNPFRMWPRWNRDRTRLLVFDRDDRIRVLDRQRQPVFETRADGEPYQYWAGALSPSGRLLAVGRSTGRPYDDDDPLISEIEIWDVRSGARRQVITVRRAVDDVGFDPTETLVLVRSNAGGPGAYSLETGDLVWHFADMVGWASCFGWQYSPDGASLAVGQRSHAVVYDARTRDADPAFDHRWPEMGMTGRTYTVRFSDDGTLLAAGGDTGRIQVRRC